MNILNSGFSKFPDAELDNKADQIVQALTGNADFAAVSPTAATLQTALDAFRKAVTLPKGQAKDEAIAATRVTLSDTMEAMARNCEVITKDRAKLATTGFDLRKDPARTDAPVDMPQNVRLKQAGVSGVVQLLCDAVPRAKAYELQYTQDPNNGTWTDGGTFASTHGLGMTGLTRGKDYWARVRAVGPSGPGAWSDPATIMVT